MAGGLLAGLDIGSTTVKLVVTDDTGRDVLHARYQRHQARQAFTAAQLLKEALKLFPQGFRLALCGSGAPPLARELGVPFVQEVVANSLAIQTFYPETRCAIELGGQDAKVIFFRWNETRGELEAADMRMNGSCAGGTGAFIDQIAELLHVRPEDFNALAEQGRTVYDISGRCGVFARTDIQPLLNQGVSPEDIALSSFHALAKQTIGGLAQGMDIRPKVLFEGGPLTFQPHLVRVFQERLMLRDEDVVVPEHPELLVAHGAALSLTKLFAGQGELREEGRIEVLANFRHPLAETSLPPLFETEEQRRAFEARHVCPGWRAPVWERGKRVEAWLGIDAGSTTTKFVLLDDEGRILDWYYGPNRGEPLRTCVNTLKDLRDRWLERGWQLDLRGAGVTGYGEGLFATAFHADFSVVETVAHARAARHFEPGVSFILDIGGQDMKAISLQEGIVTDIVLNEACSAGCGSFLETYARSLGVPVDQVARLAFASRSPSRLGSRCTVFMNSRIITEQREGKSPEDILAGLCYSIIENVFTKVLRVPNLDYLGEKIVVQGGTFQNDAVLRAFEIYTGKSPVRPPFPGLMGAIGVALLTREAKLREAGDGPLRPSRFLPLEQLEQFSYTSETGVVCPHCTNNCSRTVVRFGDGRYYITGHRCERGLTLDRETPRPHRSPSRPVSDLMALRERLVLADYRPHILSPPKGVRIGLPRVLELWHSMPFWRTVWQALGFEVVLSSPSTMKMFERGLANVPSDTVCFPAKLAHGHVLDLIDKKVDRIFWPMMNRMIPENPVTQSWHVCAVVKGYPMVVRHSDEPEERHGVRFDTPMFLWMDRETRDHQVCNFFHREFGLDSGVVLEAIHEGDRAMEACYGELKRKGQELLEGLGEGEFAVVLAGRPYHTDRLVNHGLSKMFLDQGVPVLTLDSLPGLHEAPVHLSRAETTINFHVRMLAGAYLVADDPRLEYCEIVSFGCGHEAVLTDEIVRILRERSGKAPLVIKMDESETTGPMSIRVRSFIETVRQRRRQQGVSRPRPLPHPFPQTFTRADKKLKTILIPNITESFARIASAAIRKEGYKVEPLPLAGPRAIELGKRYVHNDMCYPAQINVGEFLAAVESGRWKKEEIAFGLAKDHCDCRLANYAAVARKALDEAGCPMVPIISTGPDTKGAYPGFRLSPLFQIRMLWGLSALDVIEDLRRAIRPYELNKGQTDEVYHAGVDEMALALESGVRRFEKVFQDVVHQLVNVPHDRRHPRPKVFIIGEFLLNFHPGSNNFIERYLEDHGLECVLPHVVYNFHREYLREMAEVREFGVRYGAFRHLLTGLSEKIFRTVLDRVNGLAKAITPLYQPPGDFRSLSERAQHIIHKVFTSGEGWMIAAEILEQSDHGIENFLILQPFGCLPNHVTGRGLIKRLKKEKPHIRILALDYDPDTSQANIENRLQMLVAQILSASRASGG